MKKHTTGYMKLSVEAQKALLHDVYQRRHIEACGVLFGTIDEQGNWHIEQARPLRNTSASPVYFEFDPEELLLIEMEQPGKIVGVYHSHPSGFAQASSTDRQNMKRVNKDENIPWVWLIIRGPFDDLWPQRHTTILPSDALIAYHHYAQTGLQQINIAEEIERPAEQSDEQSESNNAPR